jgi:3,4-dihydroxy 2-butanone 4-phosphate synthase/GTP cyclohydrolase II
MDSLTQAICAFQAGQPVIIMDDDDRENEGDLCLPAAAATPELVNLILRASTGLLCVACSPRRTQELELSPMVTSNTDPHRTPFTVSVDLDPKYGTTTGVSISDRCKTIRALADPTKTAADFTRPGHIFPLRASPQGLAGRRGHTEASVELCKLAGVYPVCLIAELMNADGTMSRFPECRAFADKHHLSLISTNQIVAALTPPQARLPVDSMELTISTYSPQPNMTYVILSKGDLRGKTHVPLRIHSECLTGDVFGSQRCDCRSQLDLALQRMRSSERGLLIYVQGHEGRGIGLENKIRAYALQDSGKYDTYSANLALHLPLDDRVYTQIPIILERLGVVSVDLYTQNPEKIQALGKYLGTVHPECGCETPENHRYLETKKSKMADCVTLSS